MRITAPGNPQPTRHTHGVSVAQDSSFPSLWIHGKSTGTMASTEAARGCVIDASIPGSPRPCQLLTLGTGIQEAAEVFRPSSAFPPPCVLDLSMVQRRVPKIPLALPGNVASGLAWGLLRDRVSFQSNRLVLRSGKDPLE